jgi:steroid delta-isomerase-like uncharacterized protein
MNSAADIERVVRRYVERVWNNGDLTVLAETTTPTFRYFLGGQPSRDRAALAHFIAMTRAAFPDWRVEIDQVIAGSQAAAVRWHGQVTHRGPFRGIPATGRRITVTGINLYTIEAGQVAEEWEQTDSLGMLQQLGVLPA